MSRLLRREDLLLFAPDGDDDGGDGGGDGDGGGGGDGAGDGDGDDNDISKLRSGYDAKIADLTKQLDDLKKQQSGSASQRAANDTYQRAINQVSGYIDSLEKIDDEAQFRANATETLQAVGALYADAAKKAVAFSSDAHGAKAESFAVQVQMEVGGDIDTYRTQLMRAKSTEEMELIATKIKLENGKGSGRGTNGRNGNGGSNNNGGGRRSPDGGGGGAARTDVLNEMLDIDPTTPEGRKKWEEQRQNFQRRIGAGSR